MKDTPFWLVVPAAGIGSRMLADRPKQYLSVAGRCLIEYTLGCFLDHPQLRGVMVALAAHDTWWGKLDCAQHPLVQRCRGGHERADSVLNALQALEAQGAQQQDWVLVHDAARPNLAQEDLARLLSELSSDEVGGLLAVPARDTLKQVDATGRVSKTLDRSVIWQAYTPQMFRLGPLKQALADALAAQAVVTDEASAMEWAGFAPRLIEGRADNLKVTRPEDLQWLLGQWANRAD